MNRRSQYQMQLIDSYRHGVDCELFIVEGESAASSVSAICNRKFQAVLPLQGKPLNAYKADKDKVNASPLHHQFAQALGLSKPTHISPQEMANLNFGKVFLLFDPDADGIHIGALVLMYLGRWLPELITQGRVYLLRVPMFRVVSRVSCVNPVIDKDGGNEQQNEQQDKQNNEQHSGQKWQEQIEFAYLPPQLTQVKQRTANAGGTVIRTERYQSVGSVPPALLENLCINPDTRQVTVVTMEMIEMNKAVFG